MSTAKHTALPWRASKTGVVSGENVIVAKCGDFADAELLRYNKERWKADAALIVQAVNERDGLVRDAERYRWLQEASEADWRECSMLTKEETSQFIDAAIDAAKGAP